MFKIAYEIEQRPRTLTVRYEDILKRQILYEELPEPTKASNMHCPTTTDPNYIRTSNFVPFFDNQNAISQRASKNIRYTF